MRYVIEYSLRDGRKGASIITAPDAACALGMLLDQLDHAGSGEPIQVSVGRLAPKRLLSVEEIEQNASAAKAQVLRAYDAAVAAEKKE